jgi:hypothetical protein
MDKCCPTFEIIQRREFWGFVPARTWRLLACHLAEWQKCQPLGMIAGGQRVIREDVAIQQILGESGVITHARKPCPVLMVHVVKY